MNEPTEESRRFMICHACPKRGAIVNNQLLCDADGETSWTHIQRGDCPLKRFSDSADETSGKSYWRAMVGIAKAVMHVGRAEKRMIARRRTICRGCDHVTVTLGMIQRCDVCGCALAAKTANADQRCPINKW